MNERIRELAEQIVGPSRLHGGEFALMGNNQVEKFAELIVRECVEVVKWTPSQFPNDEYVKNIQEHFGVE